MEAAETDLPSVSAATYGAIRARASHVVYSFAADKSGIPVVDKIKLMKACHEDFEHQNGAGGIVKVLGRKSKVWTNMALDAMFFVTRCDHCLKNTARGGSTTLPTPFAQHPSLDLHSSCLL